MEPIKPKIEAKSAVEVREKLKTEGGLQDLYNYCETIFGILDKIHFAIKSRQVIDGNHVDEKLDKLLGYRGFIAPIFEAFEADMDANANAFYINRKHEIEQAGDKFVSASTEKAASLSVSKQRELRNLLRGYLNQIDIDIMVLQSKLKYYSERAKLER